MRDWKGKLKDLPRKGVDGVGVPSDVGGRKPGKEA